MREVGRRSLRFLRDGTGSGLVLKKDETLLLPDAMADQTDWFAAFDGWQRAMFVGQLTAEAERLSNAKDSIAAALGGQVAAAIDRCAGRPLQLLAELAGMFGRLRAVGNAGREEIRSALREPLRAYWRADKGILGALERFAAAVESDDGDEAEAEDDDADADEDELGEQPRASWGQRGEDLFVRAMRARAIAQASGRTPASGSRAGRLLAWLRERGLLLPDLRRTGDALLVQRAAQRLARAPADFTSKVALRYSGFRRAMRDQGRWYPPGRPAARYAHPAEADLILLAILRGVSDMESDQTLMRRLGERTLPVVQTVRQLRRYQVLVDEATDYSPVQLACMRALADPKTGSFFLSGDFNQRLTRWGSKSEAELSWVSPGIDIRRIDISYRQSRKLAGFATALARVHGYHVEERPPEHFDHAGFAPVLGASLAAVAAQVDWLARRIGEINRLARGALPTIAILVCNPQAMDAVADALSAQLADMNIRAVACPRGQVKGQDGDVRVFEVEHIKGLEFEAVFFLDVDQLQAREPELFDRYLYVGATRAATFLGLTCRSADLPDQILPLSAMFEAHW